VRLFLKQHLNIAKRYQPLSVKQSSKKEFNIESTEWTDIFAGPEPNFEDQTVIVKTFNKDKQKAIRDAKNNISQTSTSSQSSASKKNSSKSKSNIAFNSKSSAKKFDKSAKSKKKSSISNKKSTDSVNDKKSSQNITTPEEKQRQREEAKMQKLEQKRLEKEMKKQFDEDMKEWNAKRDDLACDDLLPLPKPIPIKCEIPTELFGETLVVMEFLHWFNQLFDLKSIFPFGITFELMEQILRDCDIHGPYAHLLKLMLTSILILQEDEDKINLNNDKEESSDDETLNEEEKTDRCVVIPGVKDNNYYFCWTQHHLGQQLSQLFIDPFTVSEVLRLYLRSSGAGPKPRSKYRGLYHSREDPGIRFVAENKEILSKLEFESIFDLNSEERVKVFQVMIHQVLSYITFRDHVDNAFDEIAKLKRKIRDIQTAFSKWNKEKRRNINKKDSNQDVNSDIVNNEVNSMSETTAEQLEEYKREKNNKEEEMLKNCCDVRIQIRKMQSCYNIKPLGFDRAYRRYWLFESIPGLFVEHLIPDTLYTDLPLGPCLEEPTPVKSCKPNSLDEIQLQKDMTNKNDSSVRTSLRDDSSTTSDKENEMTSHDNGDKTVSDVLKTSYLTNLSDFDRCTANRETCAIHGLVNSDQRVKWAFYYTNEHLDQLISSLNSRGYRESELLFNLKQDKNAIIDLLSKCQPNKLNKDIPMPEVRKSQRLQEQLYFRGDKTLYSQFKPEIALEMALKEYLNNTEERIFNGSLGLVGKVSREEWKEIVERKYGNKQEMINNFGYAILVLAQSVRPLCFGLPFSAENGVLDRWSDSLKQCSSLPQLFVHLSALDHSIKWSKSALKAYCKICRRKCDAELMLLCDKCNRGHHTYCLQPSLDSIPRGEWFCPNCIPKFKPQSPKKYKFESREPEESDSDINTSDSEDSEDIENESDFEISSTNTRKSNIASTSRDTTPCKEYDYICAHCNQMDPDLQLSCGECSDFYHLKCAKLSRITRSIWICPKCISKGSQLKRKQLNIDIDDESDDSMEGVIEPKRTKRSGRYSQDSDYVDSEPVYREEKEIQPIASSSRRRFDKSAAALRKSLPLDFSLCEEILKKLQKHEWGWLFRSKPNNKVVRIP
jgi:bromodomain adjacent to zinc finger domain protein 1A